MNHNRTILLGLLAVLSGPAAAQNETARTAYEAFGCYQCHGYSGQGGAAGPQLAPEPLPYNAFAEIVRRPPDRMPAYSPNVLNDETLELIYEYVESIERPPALDDIPFLSDLES